MSLLLRRESTKDVNRRAVVAWIIPITFAIFPGLKFLLATKRFEVPKNLFGGRRTDTNLGLYPCRTLRSYGRRLDVRRSEGATDD